MEMCKCKQCGHVDSIESFLCCMGKMGCENCGFESDSHDQTEYFIFFDENKKKINR